MEVPVLLYYVYFFWHKDMCQYKGVEYYEYGDGPSLERIIS